MQTSLIIIVLCVMMSAYFSATETAFSSINRIRVKNMADKGNKRAGLVLKMSENYDELLSTILIGNNIVNIASASLATVLFVDLLGDEAGPSVSTIVTTIVVLIFGEISPKSIAKESPEKFAMWSAPILRVLVKILMPVNFLFKKWKQLLSRIFHTSGDTGITEEELLTIVDEAEQDGGIDAQEGSLIRSAIGFTDMEVQDIFTPRVDVVSISSDMSHDEIETVFMTSGYSRLPVHDGNLDHVSGILYQKDFYKYVSHGDNSVQQVSHPVLFTSKYKKIGILLKELQQNKQHIAIVVDEFGGTIGLVTMEDILEEIVGEIWDEHDTVIHEIEVLSETEYRVAGSSRVEDLFEFFGKKQDFDVVTVNGWLMELLGKIPVKGDTAQTQGMTVTVEKSSGRRAETVYIKLDTPAETATEEA